MDTTFARVIEEHLELKRRNAQLDDDMPLNRYRIDDPFENHPLFKTEEQARVEDTLDGTQPDLNGHTELVWPADHEPEVEVRDPEESFWGRSRDFDWGD